MKGEMDCVYIYDIYREKSKSVFLGEIGIGGGFPKSSCLPDRMDIQTPFPRFFALCHLLLLSDPHPSVRWNPIGI